MLTEGEHGRPVTAVFGRRVAVRPAEPSVPVASWVLGGIGIASLGVFGTFAALGASDRASDGCDRGCSDASYTHVNNEFIAADVALAVGLASLSAAAIWLLVRRSSRDATHAARAVTAGGAPFRLGTF